MATYEYTATDEAGRQFSGRYDDVGNLAALREELSKMGYVLVKARRHRESTRRRQRVNQSEVVAFIYKFSETYSAGLPITRALETLGQQTKNRTFQSIISDIRESVENGSNLKQAFGKHAEVFSDFFIGMLEAGEAGGKLAEALKTSASYMETRMEMRRKVKSAFAYPVVVCIVCLGVIAGLVGFVVPVFSKIYKQLNVTLPVPTLALVKFSAMLSDYWWAIPIVAAGIALILRKVLTSPLVRAKWDVVKLKIPVLGTLSHMIMISHFARTFAMLTSVGVPLMRALEVASAVAHNHKLTEVTKEVQIAIETGNSVGEAFGNHDIFPSMITQLALSGEEVGELSQMLTKGADFLDKDIDRSIRSLMVKLEPSLTIVMGIVIAFILMAVYLPMFDYMRHLQ